MAQPGSTVLSSSLLANISGVPNDAGSSVMTSASREMLTLQPLSNAGLSSTNLAISSTSTASLPPMSSTPSVLKSSSISSLGVVVSSSLPAIASSPPTPILNGPSSSSNLPVESSTFNTPSSQPPPPPPPIFSSSSTPSTIPPPEPSTPSVVTPAPAPLTSSLLIPPSPSSSSTTFSLMPATSEQFENAVDVTTASPFSFPSDGSLEPPSPTSTRNDGLFDQLVPSTGSPSLRIASTSTSVSASSLAVSKAPFLQLSSSTSQTMSLDAPPITSSASNEPAPTSSSKSNSESDALNGTDTTSGGSKLSSFEIVGIVGGVLVTFIFLYLVWYKWRHNRSKDALRDRLDDENPFKVDEKHLDADGRTVRSSFGNDPFDDRRTGYETWHERQRHQDQERYTEWEGQEEIYEEAEQEWDQDRRMSVNGGGGSTTHDDPGDGVEESMKPFEPPQESNAVAPPGRSLTRSNSRPSTKVSEPFGYDTSYDSYDHSRPLTRMTAEDDHEDYGTMATPATSALVPWLNRDQGAAPPVPAIHPGRSQETRKRTNQAPPAPPAAVMAKTPIPGSNAGWQGTIPPFR